jgi:hypothetical protein
MKKDVVAAPMSFAGSLGRIGNMARNSNSTGWVRGAVVWPLAVILIMFAWMVITCWYLFFGLWLVPYRLVRRGSRKRKVAGRRHAELLDAAKRGQRAGG